MLPGVHTGDGYAKIERVKSRTATSTTLIRKNTKLNGIRYIRDCTTESGARWQKIVTSTKGVTIEITP